MLSQKLALAAAGNAAADPLYVEDVFGVTLRDGTGSTGTITNGIDLAAEGGMIWTKRRNTNDAHTICDSARGKTGTYYDEFGPDNNYNSQTNRAWGVTSFNSDGYSIGGTDNQFNGTGNTYVDWVFRRAPGFFDCVTYTGDGQSGRTVAHSLGSVPGCIIIKRTDATDGWGIYHKNTQGLFSDPANNLAIFWNSATNDSGSTSYWNDTTPTSSVFTLGNNSIVNGSGMSYVAYIFASDSYSFGENEDKPIIKCGGYTGNGTSGSTMKTVTVGFEPQWLMIKRTDGSGNWYILDAMRGLTSKQVTDKYLFANTNNSEGGHQYGNLTANGFELEGSDGAANANGAKYIYIAIRRPQKPPETGTDVFVATDSSVSGSSTPEYQANFTVDFAIKKIRSSGQPTYFQARALQEKTLKWNTSNGISAFSGAEFDYQTGYFNDTNNNSSYWAALFKRAAKCIDVVTYRGNGTARWINHNLEVVPEMMWVKCLNGNDWKVYHTAVGNTGYLALNTTDQKRTVAMGYNADPWDSTTPQATRFRVKTDSDVNFNGYDYIAFLFATLDGVTKVGEYNGNGSSGQNIDCGFTNGARFVLIKSVGSSGPWGAYDHHTGIVSGNESYLLLNTQDGDFTGDYIDPYSAGFALTGETWNNIGNKFMFYAVA